MWAWFSGPGPWIRAQARPSSRRDRGPSCWQVSRWWARKHQPRFIKFSSLFLAGKHVRLSGSVASVEHGSGHLGSWVWFHVNQREDISTSQRAQLIVLLSRLDCSTSIANFFQLLRSTLLTELCRSENRLTLHYHQMLPFSQQHLCSSNSAIREITVVVLY